MPFSLHGKLSGIPPQDLDPQRFRLLNVVLLDSEFSCLAKMAKPHLGGSSYMVKMRPKLPLRGTAKK